MSSEKEAASPLTILRNLHRRSVQGQGTPYWLAVLGLTLLVVLPIWVSGKPPLQDYPDHLLQTFILRNYDNPVFNFSTYYRLLLTPNPYSGYTFAIAGLNLLLPIEIAGRLFLSFYAVLFPLSVIYLFRSFGKPTNGLELFSFPLTYNILFLLGNVNYTFGVAVLFFGLGYLWRIREKITALNVILLTVVALVTYFIHAIVFGLFMAGLLITVLLTWRGWKQASILVAVPALAAVPFLIVLFGTRSVSSLRLIPYNSFVDKVESVVMPFLPAIRFEPFTELRPTLLINLGFLGGLVFTILALWRSNPRGFKIYRPGLIYGGLLVGAGLLLPLEWIKSYPDNYLNLWRADNRLLFPGAILLLASLGIASKRLPLWRMVAGLCAILLLITGAQLYLVGKNVSRVASAVSHAVPAGEPIYIIPVLTPGCGRTILIS